MRSGRGSGGPAITVTSGMDRWREAESRRETAFSEGGDTAPESPSLATGEDANAERGITPSEAESSARRIELTYAPFPKQQEFHASPAKYRLFGGAAGPGKTKALLMEAILQAHENAEANTLLLRRTFPELEQSLLLYFRRDVPRELYKSFHESKHVVTWQNGSTTRFGYCARENDVYQYQGAEFLFIGIDELTHFTLRQWQFLTSRNRSPLSGAYPCMAGATNPGNIGHAWVKSLWVDREPAAGMERAEEYDPRDYEFIRARISDNPIYAADANYLKTLEALPAAMRRAFLDGDWSIFAGQYFDRFRPAQHAVRADSIDWKPWWPRWISMDWGFEHPAAVYWHAAVPAASVPGANAGERGTCVFTYRELVTHRTPPRELAREIMARSRSLGSTVDSQDRAAGERSDAIYLSPDAFARRPDEASIAEQMGEVFCAAGWPRPTPADNDRVGGWMLMYQMLEAGEWRMTENCLELIRTLPTLVRDMARVEDIDKMDGDDAADAARYGLKSRFASRASMDAARERRPLEDRLAERVTSADPTVRAIQAKKAQIEESRGPRPVSFAHRRRPRG
ncbi:MAG: terminase large subunit domain-containing protein [Candidatus Acidiferrales bacterium]